MSFDHVPWVQAWDSFPEFTSCLLQLKTAMCTDLEEGAV